MTTMHAEFSRLDQVRKRLLDSLASRPSGLEWCREWTHEVDASVRTLFDAAWQEVGVQPNIAVVAVGGYGRAELAPYSDLDLTVLPMSESDQATDRVVRHFYRSLQELFNDRLKLGLGYAYRLINDVSGLDGKTRTGLMDARLVAGIPEPFDRFMEAFRETFPVGEFVLDKVRERQRSESATHDTPLVVEPHLKEGAGGLRAFHAGNWLREAVGLQQTNYTPAFEVVAAARNMLHLVSEKHNDRLTRQRQGEIADLTGLEPSLLAAQVADAMSELEASYQGAVELLHEARYSLTPGVIAMRGEARILPDANAADAALGVAIATELGLRVESAKSVVRPVGSANTALTAIAFGEPALRNMDRSGILESLLPEITACRTLMPTDSAHTFTVFEHSLRVVQQLQEFSQRPFFMDLRPGISSPGALVLAALLHDAGKAIPDRPHSETGAELAAAVCGRWELDDQLSAFVVWLVLEHLSMDKAVRFRDVQSPQTAVEFAQLVQTKERLDALTLLTVADVASVSDTTWTPAQEALIRELYVRTSLVMDSEIDSTPDNSTLRRRLQRELKNVEIPAEKLEAYLDAMPTHYAVSTPPDIVRLHWHMVERAQSGTPTIEFDHQPDVGTTELTVCCEDQPGLLSKLLGCLYALDLTTSGIRVSTFESTPSVALDTFTVSFAGMPLPPATCHRLANNLKSVIDGTKSVESLLAEGGKDASRRQEHFQFSVIEGTPTIIEFRAPKGRGLGFRLSRLLSSFGWNIVGARFGQWAGRGAAAFYVLDHSGQPLNRSDVEAALAPQV